MPIPFGFQRIPRCLSCLRRLGRGAETYGFDFQASRQIRGLKKSAKAPPTVKVKLLKDVKRYGRQGNVIPVAPGRMRNVWYPRRLAMYMTDANVKSARDMIVERDVNFGLERPQESAETSPVNVQLRLLPPQVATRIIRDLVPTYIEFYRSPISEPRTEAPGTMPRRTVTATADFPVATSGPVPEAASTAIYGSVSTADVAASLRALLAEDEEGAMVVLNADDITIRKSAVMESAGESDRLKTLGDFEVDIQVKGGEAVRRVVRVSASTTQPSANGESLA
ncbi:hypothetical protein MMC20_002666 [Loxospora ochrophaea]|nr:hypothetical protein [Loxospora ochrophaea]